MTIWRKVAFIFFGFLSLSTISLFFFARSLTGSGVLTISFLNIGQGDAIYIEAPNGKQIIVDGGPGPVVLSELGKVMPLFDRTIDAIIVTNPDKDHIAGFIDIMKRYKVDYIVLPGTVSTTITYNSVESFVKEKGLEKILARRGMDIVLDKENEVYLHILFPDRDVSNFTTNDGSIVAKLIYGKTSILLEGDASQKIENYLLAFDKTELDSDILKTGHHGSRTSTAQAYVEAASPDYAIISSGIDNKYGHPHKETLETLAKFNVPVLRTDTDGRITFVSDGNNFIRTE
ncbi:MAG TPA: MBL fold metallo-hydrolase [Candidatus Paceibacterota bacterium]